MRNFFYCLILSCFAVIRTMAHPMPNSVLLLDIQPNGVAAELQWPLKEFQLAFPDEDINLHPQTLTARKSEWLDAYLRKHMSVTDSDGHVWQFAIGEKKVMQTVQGEAGAFNELVFKLWLQPSANASSRHFVIHYDAIMHQVVTHKMLIVIRQDWDGGLSAKDSADADLGVLMMNTSDNKIPPVVINLDEGSRWKGFKNMVSLGIHHIAEGTDHLLFLWVLMIVAPLLVTNGQWAQTGGTRYSMTRLLKIATAFTLGHSITLPAGAVGWLRLPQQPVEIMICISILVGAAHALKPLFHGKEIWVAAGFGLVHGLAFAGTLANLHLDGYRMALSILGFNMGIECMQLFVILLLVPWLIILSRYTIYKWIRISAALFALIAATAWIAERLTQRANAVTVFIQTWSQYGQWLVLLLIIITMITYSLSKPARVKLSEG